MIRNRFTFDATMEVSDAKTARVGRDHDASFAVRFPMLAGVEMEYRWGGQIVFANQRNEFAVSRGQCLPEGG